jgi:uncharacterized protein (DUF1786 family)
MRILAIDMGTGTQDILVFDSEKPVENCVKMVMPSATQVAARRIRRAMAAGRALVLTGVNQGGGPCSWALEDFLQSGGPAFATPSAAETFDDDIERVRAMGVTLISEDEARRIDGDHVVLRDLDLGAIRSALAEFEEPGDFDGFALGCLDHGAAPPDISDRIFRFDHLRACVRRRNDLLGFASRAHELPAYLTRARAMVAGAAGEGDVVFMDTGPAAALGALHDPAVAAAGEQLILNLGNMHLLGFHLRGRQVASLFEHHTGECSDAQIELFTERLASGELENAEIFGSKGHGAYHHDRSLVGRQVPAMVAATGPQRHRLRTAGAKAYFASPFGDMMISGCFGLLRAFAAAYPARADEVDRALGPLP